MPLTPEDVRNKEFRNSFRGYNEPEVDAFLDEVEAELVRLLRENSELRDRAQTAAVAPVAAPAAAAVSPMGETEEMLRRTLLIAQRTADETVAEAKAEADRIVAAAQAHTQQLLSAAQQQANGQLGELESRRRALEQHIEGLRAFEREYRTRLKAYLETQLRDLELRTSGPAAQPTPAATAPPPTTALPSAEPAYSAGQQSGPMWSVPPSIPAVEPTPSQTNHSTDIPGGFVRRQPPQSDSPREE